MMEENYILHKKFILLVCRAGKDRKSANKAKNMMKMKKNLPIIPYSIT